MFGCRRGGRRSRQRHRFLVGVDCGSSDGGVVAAPIGGGSGWQHQKGDCCQHDGRDSRHADRDAERNSLTQPDRPFEQEVTGDGDREGDGETQCGERDAVDAHTVCVDDDEDRPVHEVDAVGDLAESHQRRQRQQSTAGSVDLKPEDQGAGHQRNHGEETLVGRPAGRRERDDGDGQHHQRCRRKHRQASRHASCSKHQRQEGTDEDLTQPGGRCPIGGVGSPHLGDHWSCDHRHGGHHGDRDRP